MAPSLSSAANDTDTTLEPIATENAAIRQKIVDSQFKCYERMNREPPYEKKGKWRAEDFEITLGLIKVTGRNGN